MNALAAAFANLRAQLAANARLRAGAWAIAAILAVYGLLVQSERVEAAYAGYTGDAEGLVRARDLLTRDDLPALLQVERERDQALTERFWQAETQGLAQAQLQAAVGDIVGELKFRNPRIQAGTILPVDYAPGLWRVQAQFNGVYEPGAELLALHALATHPKKIVVDRLDVRRRDRRMIVLVSAWFIGIQDAERTEG